MTRDLNRFIGIPFKDGEPSFDGANCITLAELFYSEVFNIEINKIRVPHDNKRRAFMQYLQEISERWDEIAEPEFGCIVAMAHSPKHPHLVQHFGIYMGNDIILHTLQKIGAHTVSLSRMSPFVKGFYKWRS